MNENQKKTTNQYRNNWDEIFGKKQTPKEELARRILSNDKPIENEKSRD